VLDECFVLNKDHVAKICDQIIKQKYDLNIWAYARVDTIDKSLLKKIKKAGINWLAIGFESGNEEVRQGVNKGRFNNKKIKEMVQMIHDEDIYIVGNFIFGLPDDNFETMRETLNLAKELACDYSNFYVAMAYPGSKLYQEALKKKTELPRSWAGYSQSNYETVPLPTRYLTSAEVLRFRDEAFEEFNTDENFLKIIGQKFGMQARTHIEKMTKTKLKRRILGD
jgi:anaerobic magnesium-protoporphyrin IX monomethyl ester cyclase